MAFGFFTVVSKSHFTMYHLYSAVECLVIVCSAVKPRFMKQFFQNWSRIRHEEWVVLGFVWPFEFKIFKFKPIH